MQKSLCYFFYFLLALLLASCVTVPGTGRSQIMLISPGEETKLGITEFEKMKTSVPISKDATINVMVSQVGQHISSVVALPNAQWEFVVFDESKTANAFCLPGGKVGIYTGILPITETDAGLATVMGHEVAHAVARHGAERLSRALLISVGAQMLEQAMQSKSEQTRALIQGAYGIGSTVGVVLPHSRENELEADRLGLFYMARAGYDPREAVKFWERFSKYNGGKEGSEFLRTHPLDSKRIAQLKTFLPQAIQEYEQAKTKKPS